MKAIIVFVLLFCGIQSGHSQQFSANVGYGLGLLEGKGFTLSAHIAMHPERRFHFDGQVFADQLVGKKFISGDPLDHWKVGLAAGVRWNLRPIEANWRPSLYLMPGYAIATNNRGYNDFVVAAGFSNTFNQRHMLTIGTNLTHYLVLLKYGFVF